MQNPEKAGKSFPVHSDTVASVSFMQVCVYACGFYSPYQREFLPGWPSMVHMLNREQQHLKSRQLSRSNARHCFAFIATPPPANIHFPISGGKKYEKDRE